MSSGPWAVVLRHPPGGPVLLFGGQWFPELLPPAVACPQPGSRCHRGRQACPENCSLAGRSASPEAVRLGPGVASPGTTGPVDPPDPLTGES